MDKFKGILRSLSRTDTNKKLDTWMVEEDHREGGHEPTGHYVEYVDEESGESVWFYEETVVDADDGSGAAESETNHAHDNRSVVFKEAPVEHCDSTNAVYMSKQHTGDEIQFEVAREFQRSKSRKESLDYCRSLSFKHHGGLQGCLQKAIKELDAPRGADEFISYGSKSSNTSLGNNEEHERKRPSALDVIAGSPSEDTVDRRDSASLDASHFQTYSTVKRVVPKGKCNMAGQFAAMRLSESPVCSPSASPESGPRKLMSSLSFSQNGGLSGCLAEAVAARSQYLEHM